MKLTVKKILEITGGKLICGNEEEVIEKYSKDTRTINQGECYVGIKGENFDGNKFYKDAFKLGAKACILDTFGSTDEEMGTIVYVDNSVEALQKIASYLIDNVDAKVVAITGSAGKTSTKDMIYSVLSKKYKVLKSQGNLNNEIGLPFALLNYINEDIIVCEMGMNGFGQIDKLSSIAKPDYAVITNIGTAHIGMLGSRENILKAKLEILNGMKKDGTLVINNDNDLLSTVKGIDQKIVKFGIDSEADYNASNIVLKNGKTFFDINGQTYNVPVLGKVNAYNALAAYTVGKLFDVSDEDIKDGLENVILTGNRMQIIEQDDYTIINDTYNANKEAMMSAFDTVNTFEARKVAILGDMLELGEFEEDIHREVGKYANGKIDVLITIGNLSKFINEEFNGEKYHFDSKQDAMNDLKDIIKNGDVILVKASQGMKLLEIVEFLRK
ncbi:MAG: UDP-N-acetylmuramoyl-tripeptide--D-alanyl-D-alanine ligase [Bacilli bacterium]|nr:UDP-N-acetylmuramoyl-tripeptide--D-alanyl-D-alanine ligase [Bacilli bacterium]